MLQNKRFNTLKEKLLYQHNIGTFIGAIKEVAGHTIFWVSMISFIMLAATTYNTTIFPKIAASAPWFSFSIFFGVLVIVVLIAMLIEYKFIIPSVLTFRNRQMGKFEFPLEDKLNQLIKEVEELKKKIDENSTHK